MFSVSLTRVSNCAVNDDKGSAMSFPYIVRNLIQVLPHDTFFCVYPLRNKKESNSFAYTNVQRLYKICIREYECICQVRHSVARALELDVMRSVRGNGFNLCAVRCAQKIRLQSMITGLCTFCWRITNTLPCQAAPGSQRI